MDTDSNLVGEQERVAGTAENVEFPENVAHEKEDHSDNADECLGSEVHIEMWEGRDQQLFKTCVKYGVEFIWPRLGESAVQTKERRESLQRMCKAARQRQKRLEMSPELRHSLRARQAERMRIKRSQMTPDEKKVFRAQQAERMRIRRQNLTSQELEIARAHHSAIVRETRNKQTLEKLKSEGNMAVKSAIEAGMNLDDLNLIKKSRELNEATHVQVINISLGNNVCAQCGKQISLPKNTSNGLTSPLIIIYNFGNAPSEVAESFLEFCASYGSLSEALLDLLDREQLLVKKYRFIPDDISQKVLGICTKEDFPDVLQTTIEAMKKLAKNCKYNSIANAIEELLFSPALPHSQDFVVDNEVPDTAPSQHLPNLSED